MLSLQRFLYFLISPFIGLLAELIALHNRIKSEELKALAFSELRYAGKYINLPLDFDFIGSKYISIGSRFSAMRGLRLHCWKCEVLESSSAPFLSIGDDVFFNREAYVSCADNISIGSNVLFGSNVLITDNYHGSTRIANTNRLSSPLSCPGPVRIENGVWIGNNVCILPGSWIGRGSIIGANSVVNSVIPAYSIAVGAPARVIGTLSASEEYA